MLEQQHKPSDLDVGVVHDWMPTLAGGEQVVAQIMRAFPRSKLYTLFDFLSEDERIYVTNGAGIETSHLNELPGIKKYYRYLLLICQRAIEQFDVTHHDIVISSSAALSKGAITSPDQKHFSYVHTPARYAWDLSHEYVNSLDGFFGFLKRRLAREMMHRFRIWDMRSVAQVDHFIANSEFIKKRIWKIYRREAEVIYPPVDINKFELSKAPRDEHFLVASRLVPYKKIPLIVEAFARRPDLRLNVVGDGPEMKTIRKLASKNVKLLGHLDSSELKNQMQTARAFVFAAKEDFGIAPVEAQACGTPVIALGQGGTAETVNPLDASEPTGVFISEQSIDGILSALDMFLQNEHSFSATMCRKNSERFSQHRFQTQLLSFINENLV